MTAQDGKIEAADMGRTCLFCMGRTFRRSRLKLKDVASLLALQYPVRCLSCSKRQSVGLETARRAVSSTVRQVKANQDAAPWDGTPWSQPRDGAALLTANREPRSLGGGVASGAGVAEAPVMKPIAMPDLHGVRLPHVAQMPPGNGENLA